MKTLFECCCKDSDFEIAKKLIEKGANVNAKDERGDTALMRAVSWGHIKIVKLLIEKGANVNIKDNNGWTAMDYFSGCEKTKALLVEAGAKNQ